MCINISSSTTDVYVVGGLQIATSYRVSMLAYTNAGDGPRTNHLMVATLCKIITESESLLLTHLLIQILFTQIMIL